MSSLFQVTGQGDQLDISQIPIDVHDSKLIEWLVSRNVVKNEWKVELEKVEREIKEGIEVLGEVREVGEVDALVSHEFGLDYFKCVLLFDAIVDSGESTDKNLLRQYNSVLLRKWNGILNAYRKNNLFLGETSMKLYQYVLYEVPAAKKSIERKQKQLRDTEKRIRDLESKSALLEKEYYSKCQELNLEGINITEEIKALINELPVIYDKIVSIMQTDIFKSAIQFYKEFRAFTLDKDTSEVNYDNLETIIYLIENGNVTSDSKNKVPKIEIIIPEPTSEGIYWGDFTVSEPIENSTEVNPTVDILWFDEGAQDTQISWGDFSDFQISAETNETEATYLDNNEKRRLVKNALAELQNFYKFRLMELETPVKVIDPILKASETIRKNNNNQQIKSYLACLREITEIFEDPLTKKILEIKITPSIVERISLEIESKKKQSSDYALKSIDAQSRVRDLSKQISHDFEYLDRLKTEVLSLKQNIELSISQLFNNRPTKIIGRLNETGFFRSN